MNRPVDPTKLIADALADQRAEFERFVRARVRHQDVDDVLQLAAARAIERAHTVTQPERVVAWLYQIHRNLIVDVQRRQAVERKYSESQEQIPDIVEATEGERCTCSVSQANQLRPSYRAILGLVDGQGVGLSEAAEQLQVSTNNATVRLHRARRALREAMFEHCGVSEPKDCLTCRCVEDNCCAA